MKRITYKFNACDKVLNFGTKTWIMGIVNCTPDSFSGDGLLSFPRKRESRHALTGSPTKTFRGDSFIKACLRYAHKLIDDGADILDIGGESTRPGALRVPLQEEIRRVIPVIKLLSPTAKIPISVDTSQGEVAHRALDAGASIINNVRGHQLTKSFLKIAREYKAGLVIMHMRGNPATMQSKAHYKNVVKEVVAQLKISVEKCLDHGIKKERIIIDPGIGFAKTMEHNFLLLAHLDRLHVLGCPVMVGTSRKSFIGKILNRGASRRSFGTAATVTAAAMNGAHLVRVHDVADIKETLRVTDAILDAS